MSDDDRALMAVRFSKTFGQNVDRVARKKRERKSTMSAKEHKANKAKRSELINFKTTITVRNQLRKLASDNKMTMTDVIEAGISLFASKGPEGRR